jgi:hypothetical protein
LGSANTNQRWACVRNAIDNPTNLAPFARSGSGFPWWGGFQYFFGSSTSLDSNSPFKRRLYDNSMCDGSLADIRQPSLPLVGAGWHPRSTGSRRLVLDA